ncbi:hypothetical protein [Hymenobacter bucti]|uniref:Uncharacterized protein n=1 Tax=Hymenobacter bucti TaxID=1844114 RepID=A0ABW4QXU1_9BACT
MELLSKLRDLFKPKPVVVPPPPLYSDEEFLDFIAAQARNRTRAEQAAQTRSASPNAPLDRAA